jgi:hypothetical protein
MENTDVFDYEPHGGGIGYYDDPDCTPFEEAFDDSPYGYGKYQENTMSSKRVTRLLVKNCEQLL